MTDLERQLVVAVLTSERFVDLAPLQIYAQLLDEGVYLCSVSTMYRVLHEHKQVKERRRLARHPAKACPELVATAPRQVYSWDITKLAGPVKGTYFDAYVMIDIYSRYIVGVHVHAHESGVLAKELIEQVFQVHGIPHVVHADASSYRDRATHACRRALRAGRRQGCRPASRARRRPYPTPAPLRYQPCAEDPRPARHRLDQPASPGGRHNSRLTPDGLKRLDKFRATPKPPPPLKPMEPCLVEPARRASGAVHTSLLRTSTLNSMSPHRHHRCYWLQSVPVAGRGSMLHLIKSRSRPRSAQQRPHRRFAPTQVRWLLRLGEHSRVMHKAADTGFSLSLTTSLTGSLLH
uniref:DDE-type integrase/transposase/recombinase n=1 Tax=Mycobacterium sp. P7213 TaxID=2478465 RepID=UPI000F641251